MMSGASKVLVEIEVTNLINMLAAPEPLQGKINLTSPILCFKSDGPM